MSKKNYFVTFLQKFNLSINSLLEKYLNKLKLKNLSNILRSNKVSMTFVAVVILFLLYLSIPLAFNKMEIKSELESQLLNKFNLNFNLSKNIDYNFFPRPHFIITDTKIFKNQSEVSNIKKLNIFVSLSNLFSLKDIVIKDVILENTNFNLNKNNYDFFSKLLDQKFIDVSFAVKNSNIFFRNAEKEVLFISKILNMKYYYDLKELKNIVKSENEIFNVSYNFTSYKNENKKIFSKLKLNYLKLQIDNEFESGNSKIKGLANIIYNKKKSIAAYEFNKDTFVFNYYDKLSDPNFVYEGKVNFNPFFAGLNGKINDLDLSNIFNPNLFFVLLIKTEILNNKNLNIESNINANQIYKYQSFTNFFINFKIQEGLIDINKTKFSWNNYADFEIIDSLLYVNKNQLVLDGKLLINIKDHKAIYKFLQISKNLRPEIEKIEFNFNYVFDENTFNSNNITINRKNSKKVDDILKKIFLKKDKLQNKIYIKKLIRDAIEAYVG